MERRLLALAAALLLGVTGYIALDYYHTGHPFEIRASDNQGHGPDYGSPEWLASLDNAIHFRSALGGAATSLLTFAAVICLCRRSHGDRLT